MRNSNELTQKMALVNAIDVLAEMENMEATVEKLRKMLAQVEKKASSKASKIDPKLANAILVGLALCEEPMTVGMMIESFAELAELKSQKVTPIVTSLVESGKVNKVTTKGRNFYLLAE